MHMLSGRTYGWWICTAYVWVCALLFVDVESTFFHCFCGCGCCCLALVLVAFGTNLKWHSDCAVRLLIAKPSRTKHTQRERWRFFSLQLINFNIVSEWMNERMYYTCMCVSVFFFRSTTQRALLSHWEIISSSSSSHTMSECISAWKKEVLINCESSNNNNRKKITANEQPRGSYQSQACRIFWKQWTNIICELWLHNLQEAGKYSQDCCKFSRISIWRNEPLAKNFIATANQKLKNEHYDLCACMCVSLRARTPIWSSLSSYSINAFKWNGFCCLFLPFWCVIFLFLSLIFPHLFQFVLAMRPKYAAFEIIIGILMS